MKWLLCPLASLAWLAMGAEPALTPPGQGEAVSAATETYVPCRIHQRAPVEFPPRLLKEGFLSGEAVVMLEVDATGELGDLLVVAHTHREFADAVVHAVRQWWFTPGYIREQPVRTLLTLTVNFQISGTAAVARAAVSDQDTEVFGARYVYKPVNISSLDRVPKPLKKDGPVYPTEWIAEGRSGTVKVDFFIDEEGRVRFARLVGEADELLAAAAVAAVQGWQFEPALHRKRPVLVRAQQVFHFSRKPDAAVPGPDTP